MEHAAHLSAAQQAEHKLRSSIVMSLYYEGQASVHALRADLERTHGLAVSALAVRGALLWLQQMGLVRVRDDRAALTELGQDVGALRLPLPQG